jgi:imidazolonepropionase-like amidohydrolase
MELEIFRDMGTSDAEVLRTATTVNAELLGVDSWIGRVAPGYAADLILVDGRPDEDVKVLTDPARIRYVMVGGIEMKNHIPANR